MYSNDSPSEEPDGTTAAATLAAEYEEFSLDIAEQSLPSYRTEELRVRIEEVRGSLAAEGVASAGQLQQLLRTVTEALADVRAAQVVPVPESRDLSQAVPGANDTGTAYEVTETEQRKTVNVLVNLLFSVVETPAREDRRRATEESGARGDDEARGTDGDDVRDSDTRGGDAGDAETGDTGDSNSFGLTGYAGPE